MDQQSQRNIEQKREIVLRLDASRRIIAEGSVGMGRRITPGHMVSSYLKRHPLVAFGATSIGVAALTYLLFFLGGVRQVLSLLTTMVIRMVNGVCRLNAPANESNVHESNKKPQPHQRVEGLERRVKHLGQAGLRLVNLMD